MRFTKTHEWITATESEAVIGITNHAQQLLGDLVFIELPRVGDDVSIGAELGVLESVKAASDFYAPIGGKIVAINEAITADPALVNHDPYGAGWLVKIKPNSLAELDLLLDDGAYQALCEDL